MYEDAGEGQNQVSGKSRVTIKGVKNGLIFILDDRCEWSELLDELEDKLTRHGQQLSGPPTHVYVKLGGRRLNEEEKGKIRAIIGQNGNLLVQSIESDAEKTVAVTRENLPLRRICGIVRAGQVVEHDGHLLLLGDVNPGGTVRCTGDIFVLGALRGIAHAGCNGECGGGHRRLAHAADAVAHRRRGEPTAGGMGVGGFAGWNSPICGTA